MDKVRTEIWVKLFEKDGRQLVVEKGYDWSDEKDKAAPVMRFRIRAAAGELEYTVFFATEHVCDEAFDSIDELFEPLASNWLERLAVIATLIRVRLIGRE